MFEGYYQKETGESIKCAIKEYRNLSLGSELIATDRSKYAEQLIRANHENVVQHFGIWRNSLTNQFSVVMELCDISLWSYLDEAIAIEGKPLIFNPREKLLILQDTCNAMTYLHSQGIVHGDLTAANVLLKSTSQRCLAKVSNFSLGALLGTQTFGNKNYPIKDILPPEVIAQPKMELSKPADVFAYGCLIIHVLICQFPKPGDGSCEVTKRQMWISKTQEPNMESIRGLIFHCLKDDPNQRSDFTSIKLKLSTLLDSCRNIMPVSNF